MALLLIATLLATLTLAPAPARALDTGETVGVIFGSMAAYVAIIFIATAAVYRHKHRPPERAVSHPLRDMDIEPSASPGLRFAPDCRSAAGTAPFLCW